jgi:hypothetical protein
VRNDITSLRDTLEEMRGIRPGEPKPGPKQSSVMTEDVSSTIHLMPRAVIADGAAPSQK